MKILQLNNCPILNQLQIEEALLRADQDNWCILNSGTTPAVVFGISGKPEIHLDAIEYPKNPLPLIRRFSGGGTVVADENTLFVTFICNGKDTGVSCCPQKILAWTEEFYKPIFEHPEFRARENDYVIGEKKFGGNAQYLCRDRWLHHTSFLWSYDPAVMKLLAIPSKQPAYRKNRAHEEFLVSLKEFLPVKEDLFERIKLKLGGRVFQLEEISGLLDRQHRKATQEIKNAYPCTSQQGRQ